jgi:hypothetical protein
LVIVVFLVLKVFYLRNLLIKIKQLFKYQTVLKSECCFSGSSVNSNSIMEPKNWRINQDAEPSIETTGWRAQIPLDSRQQIVNKM